MSLDATCELHLSIYHPYRKADEITAALRVTPDRCWDKGASCNTPDGKPLAGRHKETFWRLGLLADEVYLGLGKVVASQLDRLEIHQIFFRELAQEGGKLELWVGWDFRNSATDDKLSHRLLQRLADFRIDLELGVK